MIALDGIAVSPGVARGPAATVRWPARLGRRADDHRPAREQFDEACRDAEGELRRVLDALADTDGPARQILRAHLALVADPMLAAEVGARIDQGQLALDALEEAASALVARFEALGDSALRARAIDLRDVCNCIARHLVEGPPTDSVLTGTRVVCATNLSPAQVVQLARARPLAFVLEQGAESSHAVILMRALAVPAVIGVSGATALVRDGDLVLVDGHRGQVIVRPEPDLAGPLDVTSPTDPLEERASGAGRGGPASERAWRDASIPAIQEERASGAGRGGPASERAWRGAGGPAIQETDPEPARTRDGTLVAVTASIGDGFDARRAIAAGADGIGLFRTEWLFLRGDRLPSEEEQYAVYREVEAIVGPKPLTVRTIDLGGDKPCAALGFPAEANPALGLRGVRLAFACPDVLKAQLRALFRASRGRPLRLLLPMVVDVADLGRMRETIDEAIGADGGTTGVTSCAIGVMVETPAAALMADELAAVVDFLSIGTNDLTQYVLAVDRDNAAVAAAYQPLHPAVLRLVRQATAAALRVQKPIVVCGESAADPLAVPIFVGMGAVELSVRPTAVPAVKGLVRRISAKAARALADEVTALPTTAAVLMRLREFREEEPDGDVREARQA